MQAELAHLASPHKDLRYCPSRMSGTKTTPPTFKAEGRKRRKKVEIREVCFREVSREKPAAEVLCFCVFFLSYCKSLLFAVFAA